MERLSTAEQLRILEEAWEAASRTNRILSAEGMGIIMHDDFSGTIRAVSYAEQLTNARELALKLLNDINHLRERIA